MKPFSLVSLSLVLSMAFMSTPAGAQQTNDCGCSTALNKDLVSVVSSESQFLAFLVRIDEQTFEEFRKDAGFLVKVPILEGLVKASANYSDFSQRRRSYLEERKYISDATREYSELQVSTAAVAYPYWSECMRACATNRTGLFAWKEKEWPEGVVVRVYYHAPPGGGSAKLSSTLRGGTVKGAKKDQLFPPSATIKANEEVPVTIDRAVGDRVIATMSAAGYTAQTIESEARKPNRALTFAQVHWERNTTRDEPAGERCANTQFTDNNHNNSCDGQPCSPDGRWQASDRATIVNADNGGNYELRSAAFRRCWALEPVGIVMVPIENAGACQFSRVLAASLDSSKKHATGVFRGWSRPTLREFCAQQVLVVSQTASGDIAVPVLGGDMLTFYSPNGTKAVLNYVAYGKPGVLSPGDSTAELRFIRKVELQANTHYQYEVIRTPQ